MDSLQKLQDQLSDLLAELINIAEELRDLSRQVVSEDELAPLQLKQESLLQQIEKLDSKLHKNYANEIEPSFKEALHEKLSAFQHLNQEFITNLNASHGLIQFELRTSRPQEENL